MEVSTNWLDWVVVGTYIGVTIVVAIAVFTSNTK